jgi:hypothetical protein
VVDGQQVIGDLVNGTFEWTVKESANS